MSLTDFILMEKEAFNIVGQSDEDIHSLIAKHGEAVRSYAELHGYDVSVDVLVKLIKEREMSLVYN